jgi:hypothetical protein
MKKLFILLLFALFFNERSAAQTVLLNVDRASETNKEKTGPNQKKFSHVIFRAGIVAFEDKAGARVKPLSSVNIAFGVRNKYKIGTVYSLGYDIETQFTDYKMKQDEDKIFPDTILNNVSQRLDYTSFGLGFYNRFNFDPGRGDFLGTFIDLGIMGTWDFSIKQISKNKMSDGTLLKNIVKHLPYVNNFNSKVYVRAGYSHLSVYGSYRLTDLFKSSYHFPDLPRFIIGVEIALF